MHALAVDLFLMAVYLISGVSHAYFASRCWRCTVAEFWWHGVQTVLACLAFTAMVIRLLP